MALDSIDPSQPYDVLALAAHPDDVEMGMGGSVAALCAAGRRVAIVSLTQGELGTHGDAQTRRKEAAAAAEILGCHVRHLDLPDGAVQDDLASRHRVARLIRELKPSVIFAPYPHARTGPLDGRSNVDHLAAGALANAGSKLARFRKLFPELEPHAIRRLWYYMVPDHERPSVFVDVTAHRDTLAAAIEAYASQMPIERSGRDILSLLLMMRQNYGLQAGCELAEAFLCEDPIGGDPELLMQI